MLGLRSYFTDAYATTGVSGGDIAFLHNYIREHRPRRVIEFGTGKSTWVIARCMELYCWDRYDGDIRLVSMEESDYWYDEQLKYFPKHEIPHFDDFVEVVLSGVEDYRYGHIVGKSYVNTPREHFDFGFVDGPDAHGTCNMDLIKLVEVADKPVSAVVDNRKSTQIAYAVLLGRENLVRYHTGLCHVRNVTKADLRDADYGRFFPGRLKLLRL
ncbi:MAG: hypothetical protein AB7U38_03665 [Hyphomicrobiales bacterium]